MKPGRNDPCPCGSGLKFKKCCANQGSAAAVAVEAEAAGATAAEAAATEPTGKPRTNTWELLHKYPAERGPSRMGRKKPK